MDRRSFLATGATSRCCRSPKPPHSPPSPSAGTGDARINQLFEISSRSVCALAARLFARSRQGAERSAQSKFDTVPAPVGRRKDLARNRRAIAELRAISPTTLSDAARLNREVVLYSLETATAAPSRWDIDSAQRPYRITQQGGAYFSLPDFLNTAHTINNAADAEAYLSRLNQFPTVLDNDTAEQRAQAARGFLAPAWAIDLTLGQMRKLRNVAPESNTMVNSIVRRTKDKGIAGDWQRRASAIVASSIYPALDRQIAAMGSLKPTTRPGDGAWRLTMAKRSMPRRCVRRPRPISPPLKSIKWA